MLIYGILLGISGVLALGGLAYAFETEETGIYWFGLLMGAIITFTIIGILVELGG